MKAKIGLFLIGAGFLGAVAVSAGMDDRKACSSSSECPPGQTCYATPQGAGVCEISANPNSSFKPCQSTSECPNGETCYANANGTGSCAWYPHANSGKPCQSASECPPGEVCRPNSNGTGSCGE